MTSSIADFVVSMGTDGRILSQGSISDALAKDTTLAKAVTEEQRKEQKAETQIDDNTPETKNDEEAGKLVMEEETALGHLSWSSSAHCLMITIIIVVAYAPVISDAILRRLGREPRCFILGAADPCHDSRVLDRGCATLVLR